MPPMPSASQDPRGTKRPRGNPGDDDDDDDEKGSRERRKIEIKFIEDKSRRHITFSKRKAGIMKKVSINRDLFQKKKKKIHIANHLSPGI